MTRTASALMVALAALVTLVDATPAVGQAPSEGVTAVQPVADVTAVTTGGFHGCARTEDHRALCWGHNANGQLGIGTTSTGPRGATPVQAVAGTGALRGVTGIAAGFGHTCAVLANREARCWGAGAQGQLGNGQLDRALRPVPVLDTDGDGRLQDVAQITASADTTCARLVNGQARCWGVNANGELGNGSTVSRSALPVAVSRVSSPGPLTDVALLDAGPQHVCARLGSGQARCWGKNLTGQLGDGTTTTRRRPVVVVDARGSGPLRSVQHLSAGGGQTCAVLTDATARCWGTNGTGQLGDGTRSPRRRPTAVANASDTGPLRGIASLAVGTSHSCAQLRTGEARCWGDATFAQIGNGATSGAVLLPAPVRNQLGSASLTGVSELHTDEHHTCVALQGGQARCWGLGSFGSLGNRDEANRPLPVTVITEPQIMAPTTVASVAP